jgi:hypothetical protein
MEKPITTIDALAEIIQRTMASREGRRELRTEMKQGFESVESRLGKIENLLLAEQMREIEDLKKRMKRLEDAVAL